MKRKWEKIIAMVVIAVSVATGANAGDMLAQWNFNGVGGGLAEYGPDLLNPVYEAGGVIVDGLNRGGGVKTDHGISLANVWGGVEFTESTWQDALIANKYFSLVLEAEAGATMSLTGFESVLRSTAYGPTEAVWLASYNGDFSGSFMVGDVFALQNGANPYSFDFGTMGMGMDFNDITYIEFRLVVWGAPDPNGQNGAFQFGNGGRNVGAANANTFTVYGTTVIPEPSTALLALSGVALLAFRRKRRRSAP